MAQPGEVFSGKLDLWMISSACVFLFVEKNFAVLVDGALAQSISVWYLGDPGTKFFATWASSANIRLLAFYYLCVSAGIRSLEVALGL